MRVSDERSYQLGSGPGPGLQPRGICYLCTCEFMHVIKMCIAAGAALEITVILIALRSGSAFRWRLDSFSRVRGTRSTDSLIFLWILWRSFAVCLRSSSDSLSSFRDPQDADQNNH